MCTMVVMVVMGWGCDMLLKKQAHYEPLRSSVEAGGWPAARLRKDGSLDVPEPLNAMEVGL